MCLVVGSIIFVAWVCDSRCAQHMKVMQAQKKMDMKKLLEQEKMELHHQIKRRIALETIVSALEVRAINGYGIYIYAWGGGGGMLLYLVVRALLF